ncbi:MAG: efflux transporter outer membrane subunit [Ignavibacteria bacterium]
MIKRATLVLCAAALGGCSFAPDYLRPAAPVAPAWPEYVKTAGSVQAAATDWRSVFPDPRLQALIGAALEYNRDMRIAVARVEEARALYGVARADRFPTINVAASRNAALTPGDLSASGRQLNTQRYDAGLSMPSFELDFWGRVRNLDEAARAGYLASVEAQRAFRLSLISDVANAYLTLLEMEQRRELAQTTLKSRSETRDLIAKRREVGLASDLDYLSADSAYTSARAEYANIERQRDAAENALTLLVGAAPADLPAGNALRDQRIVSDFAVGLPSEVLLVRPDIAAAEQRLIASNANIGAARAAFLPKILLTATLGSASTGLSRLFEAGQGAWTFQPALTMPLFDSGRTAANVDVAEARKVVAVAEYEKAIQQAFREVADLLSAREKLASQSADLDATQATQAERLKLATARYDAGISSYLEVLDAQRELFSAQQNAVQARRQLLSTGVQLYKALGGDQPTH